MTMLAFPGKRAVATEPVTCPACLVHYRPALTRNACPVCDADAPGLTDDDGVIRAWVDPDTRVVAIVVMATILNLILLAVLVIVASNA